MKRLFYLLAALSAAACAQDRGALPLPASGNVTLPLDEYNRLVALAGMPVKKPDTPPVAYTIQSAVLKFQVNGEAATGSIELDGEVLQKGAFEVPLVHGLTVMDARQKDAELALKQAAGVHSAVLSGPGDFYVTLRAGMPLRSDLGRASLSIPVPSAGSARLELTVPGDHTLVTLSHGLITARHSVNGQTMVEATLVPGQQTSVWWAAREPVPQTQAPREVRFLSDVKTLVTVGEADFGLTALVDITVVQGDPAQFEIALPAGYEVTGATGPTLESSTPGSGVLLLRVANLVRAHQFLLSLTKANTEPKAEVPILTVNGTQRETGEVLVEGEGAMELTANESGSLKRMDVKEVSSFLRDLARHSLHAAFRYHRQAADVPGLALEWKRFPDSSLQTAVAQDAEVTTMVTSDGKSITEVKLTVKNQGQSYLKVALPPGANIVSAEVAGERVKPVEGADGNRVPLLRVGFRPAGPYQVSFVYMDSGAAFARKGGSELALPKMDVPIGLVRWEVFLPERYKVTNFGGDVVAANLMPKDPVRFEMAAPGVSEATLGAVLTTGQLGGIVRDPSGATVGGAHVTVRDLATGRLLAADTDSSGRWAVAGAATGKMSITISRPGFKSSAMEVNYNAAHPVAYGARLEVGVASQTVEVVGTLAGDAGGKAQLDGSDTFTVNGSTSSGLSAGSGSGGGIGNRVGNYRGAPGGAVVAPPPPPQPPQQPASANVLELQKRVSGVLPIPVDVPRAGTSFRFVRPLVVDEETRVTFSYKTK